MDDLQINPKVSIVIPVYNGSNYLREAIDSALNQTYKNIEIIVVNDGSNDFGETEKIAKSYGNKIRYFYKENGGVATALNLGLEKMEGEYFSWLSHDDIYKPEKIEKQVNLLTILNETKKIIFSGYETITINGKHIRTYAIPPHVVQNIRCLIAIDLEYTLNGCTMLIPKCIFNIYGGFNAKYRYTQDYDMWWRFSENVEYIYLDESLILSRQHPEQGSRLENSTATVESDLFHARVISALCTSEISSYADIKKLREIYEIFYANSYNATSIVLLTQIVKILLQKNHDIEAMQLLNQTIFCFDQLDRMKDIFYNDFIKSLNFSKDKQTLLFYVNIWVYGGIERVMSILMRQLYESYNIILISYNESFQKGFELPNDIVHLKISENNLKNIAYRLGALSKLLDVKLFIGNPNIIYETLPVYGLLKKLSIKSIAVNHGYYFLPYYAQWLHPLIENKNEFLKDADAVTWLTSFNYTIYSMINENGIIMPNPNTFDEIDSNIMPHSAKIILCVGRFYDSIKRVDRVLKVFSKLIRIYPNVQLVLVGGYDLSMHIPSDSSESIRQLIARLRMPEHAVVFIGEQSDVANYYKKADVFVMTSDNEGFGMVLNEAGAFGLPIVMFRIPGLEDIIMDGKNGFLIEQDDYAEFVDKLVLLLSNDNLRLSMGQKAKILAKRFCKREIGMRWRHLIETILKTNSSEILNQILKREFSYSITKGEHYTKDIVCEYERNIKSIMQTYQTFVYSKDSKLIIHENKEGIVKLTLRYYRKNGLKSTIWKIVSKFRQCIKLE